MIETKKIVGMKIMPFEIDGVVDPADEQLAEYKIKVGTHIPASKDDKNPVIVKIWYAPISSGKMEKILDSVIEDGIGRGKKKKVSSFKSGRYINKQIEASVTRWEGVLDGNDALAPVTLNSIRGLPNWISTDLSEKITGISQIDEEEEKN